MEFFGDCEVKKTATNLGDDSGRDNLDAAPHDTPGECEHFKRRKQLTDGIARSVEAEIRQFTSASLGTWPAEILNIEFDAEGLLLSARLPFPIFEPSAGKDDWPGSRRKQECLRTKYAEHLFRQEKQLASFFYQKLVEFIIEYRRFDRFGPDVIKRLNSIAQREFAGHPTEIIQPAMGQKIRREGRSVWRTIELIRDFVKLLQKKDGPLRDSQILKRLRRKFPQSRFPWVEHFYALSGTLPRRRYWSASSVESATSENMSPDGKRPPCTIAEPGEWSIVDITARVVQAHFRKETSRTFALLKIKGLIR
jgi:hypothetical protein